MLAAVANNQSEPPTTGLAPFYRNDDGQSWDSELVRDTVSFGYVYDTTANVSLTGESAPEALGRLREIINEKYGRESPATMLGEPRRRMSEVQDGVVAARFRQVATAEGGLRPNLSGSFYLPRPPLSTIVRHGNRYTEWLINVRMRDKEMDRPTSLLFFIGDVPDEPGSWRSAPNMVGTFETFFMGGSSTSGSQISGTVPLTAALLKMVAGALRSILSTTRGSVGVGTAHGLRHSLCDDIIMPCFRLLFIVACRTNIPLSTEAS